MLKKFDLYGHPVGLSYDGDDKFKSSVGGLAGLITLIIIVGYLAFCVINIINKSPTITNSQFIINTSVDKTEY